MAPAIAAGRGKCAVATAEIAGPGGIAAGLPPVAAAVAAYKGFALGKEAGAAISAMSFSGSPVWAAAESGAISKAKPNKTEDLATNMGEGLSSVFTKKQNTDDSALRGEIVQDRNRETQFCVNWNR
jgi:hypothetical protein